MAGDTGPTLLVTVDSFRADAIGSHTPALQSLADRGTVFENAFAQGNWTPFSFPSLLGGRPVFSDGPDIGVGTGPTLAETLSKHDVETAGFNAANGFLTEYWGYDRGFDEFETFLTHSTPIGRALAAHPTVQAWSLFATQPFRSAWRRLRGRETHPAENTSRLRDLEERATAFLESADPSSFCWVHYMDTHTPYVPAPAHVKAASDGEMGTPKMLRAHIKAGLGQSVGDRTLEDLRTLYAGAARQVDASVGRLLSTLEELGLREETTVIVAGDHGEEFQEHGHLAHYPKLYGELIEVPLIVDAPGDTVDSVETPVGLDAVPATVGDAMDVPAPPGATGESLLPAVRGEDSLRDEPVVSVTVRGESVTQQPIPRHLDDGEVLVSARTAAWTYIRHAESGRTELYDRRADPVERTDRWGDETDAPIDALERAVERRLETIGGVADAGEGAAGGRDEEDVDDDIETRLEALGYR
ncbi:MAG: sulfatase [Halobacteriales archaeon]